jgi:hypothetical protein
MGALHDRACRQPGVTAAFPAAQDAGSAGEAKRRSRRLAMGQTKLSPHRAFSK